MQRGTQSAVCAVVKHAGIRKQVHTGTELKFTYSSALHRAGRRLKLAGQVEDYKNQWQILFSVKAMSKVFRARFLAALRQQLPLQINPALLNQLYKKIGSIYQMPFCRTKERDRISGHVYHKIAISNSGIKNIEQGKLPLAIRITGNKVLPKK